MGISTARNVAPAGSEYAETVRSNHCNTFNNVHVWGFWWPVELSKLRRVLLGPLLSYSGRVGCYIVMLKFFKSVEMHNGHEWVRYLRKDCTMVTLNEARQSRSCMIFSRPQRCRRFDGLPDSGYSRYTPEMAVRENPNFIAT
ncbi:hypothetical protein TNCV_932321 [Trichonephila clavipes]|nr:hypothetical protein TNCV_932321 [Trichonephila clavipes]